MTRLLSSSTLKTILIFSALAVTQITTATTVTIDQLRVGWVSTESGRGTSDILWSGFVTYVACSWKCLHQETSAGFYKWRGIPYWAKTTVEEVAAKVEMVVCYRQFPRTWCSYSSWISVFRLRGCVLLRGNLGPWLTPFSPTRAV